MEQAGPAPGTRLERLGQSLAARPARAFVLLLAVILVADFLGAWAVEHWLPVPGSAAPFLDAAIDIAVLMPLLILLFLRPIERHIRARAASERDLRAARNELERRVSERTAELQESNGKLREEVDERRLAQAAVEFQAGLLDAVAEAVVAIDQEGRVRFWNRFAEGLFGSSAAQAVGRPFVDLIGFAQPGDRRVDVIERCRAVEHWTEELEARRGDGSSVAVLLSCSRLPDATEGYVCVCFDITEWLVAREALRDSEEKYSNLVDHSPTGVFILQNNRLVFVNPRFAEILGYSQGELSQVDPWSLVHPDDRARVAAIGRSRTAGDDGRAGYECRLITKQGECRWVAMRNTRVRYGGAVATLGNAQDVTLQKEMEIKLRQLSARLLTIQEEERRRLALDLHDSLGQTLTGIKFMIEASLGESPPLERRAGIARLRSVVPRIQAAVEEVRQLATGLRPSILDDLGLLPTIVWYLRELQNDHPGIAVEQRIDARECEVPNALRTPVFRILQEATNNVVKHSGASRLIVALETSGGSLCLSVRDDGVGFAVERPSSTNGSGHWGIGLSSMRERAEVSGGSCSVITAPGAGVTVEACWALEQPFSEQ